MMNNMYVSLMRLIVFLLFNTALCYVITNSYNENDYKNYIITPLTINVSYYKKNFKNYLKKYKQEKINNSLNTLKNNNIDFDLFEL